jgi:uncharacterized membrane protein
MSGRLMPNSSTNFESHLRSVAKGISYRIVGTLSTATLSFAVTGSTRTAMILGSAEVVVKLLLFWGHERVWARVPWGRKYKGSASDAESSDVLHPLSTGAVADGGDLAQRTRRAVTAAPSASTASVPARAQGGSPRECARGQGELSLDLPR